MRFQRNRLAGEIEDGKGSRRWMGGFNYYIAQQNFKVTAALERIVPNVAGAPTWRQKNTNHLVVQMQLFYF